jgi:D-serine deaminase-like pyridoxal phosphate-dependent protein
MDGMLGFRIMVGVVNLNLDRYRITDEDRLLTPALAVYPEFVDANIAATLKLMHGDANRWRPHIKTAKMPWVIRRLIERGVRQFKCATTLELRVACECGASDVLLAYAVVGSSARRVIEIAREYSGTRVSVLIENPAQFEMWRGHGVGIFVDVNPGMDRTGMDQSHVTEIGTLARMVGAQFRGLHYYDGHHTEPEMRDREKQAHLGYARLMEIVGALGVPVGEVITSGTPAFACAMTFAGFDQGGFIHRASPGTVIFNDMSSLAQMPEEFGYQAAAVVIATVVSHPLERRITCNAGHKAVSADAGVPTCAVIGWPGLNPLKPSEEHLPIDVAEGDAPAIGDLLYLLPRHICPSVNLFDEALMVRDGGVVGVEAIAARGHERALAGVGID